MRQFYVACNKALKQAQNRNVFGTIAWLTEAEKHHDRLRGPALARLEANLITHLDRFLQATAQACYQFWGREPAKALVELLKDAGPFCHLVERISPLPTWDKTVQGGSLVHRWDDARDVIQSL